MEKLMKYFSLKINDKLFKETDNIVSEMKITKSKYFNEALHLYNFYIKRKKLKKQLHIESTLTRIKSLEVLREFESVYENNLND